MISKSLTQSDSKRQLWLAAIKLPMYTVAVIPITVGTAVAFADTQKFHPQIFWTFIAAAISIIVWLNLTNDVFDADTGIDVNKAESVVNLTGKKSLVFAIANCCLILGILGIVAICWWLQDLMVLWSIILCCALGYSYQGPPFRLGYQGLGEIICFVTFGPMAIAAAYYSQVKSFSSHSLAAGVLIGITTSIILFCSHFHQVKDDLAAGKLSPIVRLGTYRGAQVLKWSTISVFFLTAIFIVLGYLPISTAVILASIPLAYKLVKHVVTYHDCPEEVRISKFLAVRWHFVSGLLLVLGLTLPSLMLS